MAAFDNTGIVTITWKCKRYEIYTGIVTITWNCKRYEIYIYVPSRLSPQWFCGNSCTWAQSHYGDNREGTLIS